MHPADSPSLRERGLMACGAIGNELGLPTKDLHVLSDRGSLMVHLRPAPVVARVSTLTAFTRAHPVEWLAREVAVAEYAARLGGPVVPPAPNVDPGPHTSHGLSLSLWTYQPPNDRRPTPREVGVALAELHDCLRGFPGELATLAPAREQVTEALDVVRAADTESATTVDRLLEKHRRLLSEISGATNDDVLHGDAHPGNMMWDGSRWLWFDLEETCRGPVLWDLAILARSTRTNGAEAIRAYCATADLPIPSSDELAPYIGLREIEAAAWASGIATVEPGYRDTATALVKAALGS